MGNPFATPPRLADCREFVAERLPKPGRDFVDGGSGDERTPAGDERSPAGIDRAAVRS